MAVTIYQTDGTFFVQFPGQSPVGRTGGSLIKYRYAAGEWFQILFNGDVLFNEFWSDITVQGEFPALDPNQKSDQIDEVISDYTAAGGSGGTGPGVDTAQFRGWADQFEDLATLSSPQEGQIANVDTIQYRYTGGSWQSTGITVLKQFPNRPTEISPFEPVQGVFAENGDTLEASEANSVLNIARFSREGDYVEFVMDSVTGINNRVYIGYWEGSGSPGTSGNWVTALELRPRMSGTQYRIRNFQQTSGTSLNVPVSATLRLVIIGGVFKIQALGVDVLTSTISLGSIPEKKLAFAVASIGDRIPLNYTFSS